MSEDQIIALLGEIRDLQKQHIENYKMALANQQQALDAQKQAMRRARTMLVVVAGLCWRSTCYLQFGGGWGGAFDVSSADSFLRIKTNRSV